MGFKVDTSFLKFLTMGARGAQQVTAELKALGFAPIELERYCTSNKIWSTKVKRLRMPDLLCVRTGLRIEVRAKSDLKIRMSDAPNNADRTWDAGAADEDVIAFIACDDDGDGPVPADRAVYFDVAGLRASVGKSVLGPPKSASEGAERDRTWPATVPGRSGIVESVDHAKLVVMMDGGNGTPPRRQTYTLNGKTAYVAAGDRFEANVSIIAGAPPTLADLRKHLGRVYDPIEELANPEPVARYAAAKAIRFRRELHENALSALEAALAKETEPRTALELAGSLTALGSATGRTRITEVLRHGDPVYLRMEAIFILTEIADDFARDQLVQIANDTSIENDERRQAALWGLGKAGLKAYHELLPHIADPEENVAFHAIVAFGVDTPVAVIDRLVELLLTGDDRLSPAASEALRLVDAKAAVNAALKARELHGDQHWLLATIGRLDPTTVRIALKDNPLLQQIEPMLLLADGANWLSSDVARSDFAFLAKQN